MSTKICSKCKKDKDLDQFTKDSSRPTGLSYHCNSCRSNINHGVYKNIHPTAIRCPYDPNREPFDRLKYARLYRINDRPKNAAYAAKRRASKLQATPNWYEHVAIRKMYEQAKQLTDEFGVDYQVDHIVPLIHDSVCGLHCLNNLQIITAKENRIKNNTFTY